MPKCAHLGIGKPINRKDETMNTFKRTLSMLLIVAMLLSCLPAAVFAAETAGETYIQDLEVDQRTNPLGIDNLTPEFRWEMVSDVRGQKQTAYQIVVKDGDTTVWDTGKVTSDVSNAIRYKGSALESATRYDWTVTVWDKDGNALESKSAWFEMGLLNKSDWEGANFIAPSIEGVTDPMATDQYTIDFDFIVVEDNMGFCFNMSDTSNFIMWQINTIDGNGAVLLRPHFMAGGSWKGYPGQGGYNVQAVDITSGFGVSNASEIVGKEYHLRLVVSGANIKTYVGAAGTTAATPVSELKQVDDYTYSGASSLPFRGIGFRHSSDANAQETAKYDNFVAVCNKTGETLYTEDFSSGKIPFTGQHLQLIDGWLQVGTTSTSGGEVRTVATKPALGASAPMFRKEFAVKEGLVSARLYATSLGIYEAFINGEKAGVDKMAPGWTDYKQYVHYQTYDITDMLNDGDNAIGAVVGNGWYSGYVSVTGNNHYGTDEAFIGKIVLTYADGTVETVGTDATWKSYTNGPWVETDNQNGETYDATKEVPGWTEPGLDTKDWTNTKIATSSTIRVDSGMYPESVALVAQTADPVQEIEYLPATFLAKTAEDTYVYDLGQNISGVIRINVKGEAGTTMKLRFGEMVYKDTNALYTANLRSAKATDYYTLKGDENGETYQPTLTFHGFRYFEVSGLGYQPAAEDVIGVVIHSKLDRTGYVETNNELVNKLFSNIIWGHRDNYLSIPTDCPQRDERMGWIGDASVFTRTASMNFDINAFYTKYIRDVYTASKNGNMPSIAPIEPHPGFVQGASVWGDFAVIGPWAMYTAYGDTAILEEAWPYMTGWISYYENTKAGSDYISNSDTYGDWLAISESSDSRYTSTCFYAHVTGLVAKMATILGKTEEAAYYSALEQNIKDAIVKTYVNTETGIISANTQTTYVLALAFDILPTQELREKAAANLVARIEAKDWHLSGGFIGIENLLPVLTEFGYNDVAYQLLLTETYPSWLYPVVNGATTMWERWNSYIAETGTFGDVSMNSFNHYSFGAVGAWMYQVAGGIQYDEMNPGYKHFTIAPNPNSQLDEFKVTYESVHGEIVSDWTLKNGVFTLKASVPANTTATVVVPSDDVAALTVDGKAVTEAVEGVEYVGTADGKSTFEVVSGDYVFTTAVKERYSVTASGSVPGGTFVNTTVNGESGRATVVAGEEAVIEAKAVNAAEWEFVGWTGSVESTENPLTVVVEDNMELEASYRFVGKASLASGITPTTKSNAGGYPGFYPGGLTDGKFITVDGFNGWTSTGYKSVDSNEWIQIDLGAVTAINEVHLYPRTDVLASDGTSACFPVDYTIQVSENGTDWTPVVTEVGHATPAKGEPVFHTFDTVNARYVKLDVTKLGKQPAGDANYRVQLAEFGIYNTVTASEYDLAIMGNGTVLVNGEEVELPYVGTFAAGSDVIVEAVSTATSLFSKWTGSVNSTVAKQSLYMGENKALNAEFTTPGDVNLALKKQVTGNNTLSSGSAWGPQLLTDGLFPGTGYSNNDTSAVREGSNEVDFWLYIDLGETKLLDTIVLYPRNTPAETAAGKTPSYPNTFSFQVSDDAKEWTVVKSVADERVPGAGEAMTYDFAPVAGRYVKLQVTKAGLVEDSDKYYRLQLQEEEIYNKDYIETVAFTNEAALAEGDTVEAAVAATTAKGNEVDLGKFDVAYTTSNDAVAAVENGVITAVGAGEAVITATVTVNGITYTAEQTVTVAAKAVELIVTGTEKVTMEKEGMSFTVSAANTNALATATLAIELKGDVDYTWEVAEGWTKVVETFENGRLTIVLVNLDGVTSKEAVPMLTVNAKLTGKVGDASVTVTKARLSAYVGTGVDDGEVYVEADLTGATYTTKVDYNTFDVNRDGQVCMLDITRAQRHFGTDDAICDVNDDGTVDIEDLILILNNYTVEI